MISQVRPRVVQRARVLECATCVVLGEAPGPEAAAGGASSGAPGALRAEGGEAAALASGGEGGEDTPLRDRKPILCVLLARAAARRRQRARCFDIVELRTESNVRFLDDLPQVEASPTDGLREEDAARGASDEGELFMTEAFAR